MPIRQCLAAIALIAASQCVSIGQSPPPRAAKPEIFEIEGHKAYLHAAPKPADGIPWVWYAPIVKGDFLIVKFKAYFDSFRNAGIAVAGFDLGEVRGAPESSAKFTQFYEEMVKRGYSAKPILLGQSRGGIMTLAWAVRNPEKVKAWVGIYPVCNLASYPLKHSKKETLADYGLTEAELRNKLAELNPVDNLADLAKIKVPLFPSTATRMLWCLSRTTPDCSARTTRLWAEPAP